MVRRLVTSGGALAFALSAAVLVGGWDQGPAGAQGSEPFNCDGSLYITTGTPADMQLTRVDQESAALTDIGGGGLVANAIGFNPVDNFLYGMRFGDPHDIVRVGADGTETSLGPATGTPARWTRTFVGTFLEDGHYLVLGATSKVTSEAAVWAEIDVATTPPRVLRTFSHPSVTNDDFADVALNPVDRRLYALSRSLSRVVRIDRATGGATPVGPVFNEITSAGSTFFDSFGRLWLYGRRAAGDLQDTLFRIDRLADDGPEVVGSGPAVGFSDGASCPLSVAMDKTVEPDPVCAGATVTYRYTITNQTPNASPITADFDDEVGDGRTYVPDSLENPFGGSVGEYAGASSLHIDDLALSGNSTETISVGVRIPPDTPPGALFNQAELTDLSGSVGPRVISEYPVTPEAPDPTPVQVRACVDLAVDKVADVDQVGAGDEVAFTITVTNHGPSDATAVSSLRDTLPDGLEFEAASDGGTIGPDGVVSWPEFDLATGATRTVTVTARGAGDLAAATADPAPLVNVVTVDHPDDTNADNDRDEAEVERARPDLVVTKDDGLTIVEAGQRVTYTLVVSNRGPGAALGVYITDELPPETRFVEASDGGVVDEGTVTWGPLDLRAGDEVERWVTVDVVEVTEGEDVVNVAAAPVPADLTPDDNSDTDVDETLVPTEVLSGGPPPTPAPDPPPGALPRTGSSPLRAVILGLALAATGTLGVATARYRARRGRVEKVAGP